MTGGWVYIVTNRPNGTLYVGVTSDLARCIREHRDRAVGGFSGRFVMKRLVHAEWHDDNRNARQRETSLKGWSRAQKVRLIIEHNPMWRDLYEQRPL
jgi:putative endonuclease